MEEKNCLHCDSSFKPKTHNQKFCQKQCRIDHNKGIPPPPKTEEQQQEEEAALLAPKVEEQQQEQNAPLLAIQTPKIEEQTAPEVSEKISESASEVVNSENSEEEKTLEMPKTMHLNSDLNSEKISDLTPIDNEAEKTLEMPKNTHLDSDLSDSLKNSDLESENGEDDSEAGSDQNSEVNSEQNGDLEHFDLGDYLGNNETVEKEQSSTIDTPPPNENEDFDQEKVQQIEQEKEAAFQVVNDLESEAVKVLMNPKEAATISVTAFSVFQDFLLPFIYKKTAFTKPQESRLKSLARLSKEKKLDKLTIEDYELLDEWAAYEDYKELVPLSKKEKELLQTPLEKLFQSSDGKGMSPFWALVLVLITILSSRMIPIATAFKNRNKFDVETKHLRANHRKEGLRKE